MSAQDPQGLCVSTEPQYLPACIGEGWSPQQLTSYCQAWEAQQPGGGHITWQLSNGVFTETPTVIVESGGLPEELDPPQHMPTHGIVILTALVAFAAGWLARFFTG